MNKKVKNRTNQPAQVQILPLVFTSLCDLGQVMKPHLQTGVTNHTWYIPGPLYPVSQSHDESSCHGLPLCLSMLVTECKEALCCRWLQSVLIPSVSSVPGTTSDLRQELSPI